MKIAVIGGGYVGLVSSVCFAELGHEVHCVDNNPHVIKSLLAQEVPIYEPGLEEMLRRNCAGGRLSFSDDLKKAVTESRVVFIAVGTPSDRNGRADVSLVFHVVESMAAHLQPGTLVVIKSTVPVGTNRRVAEQLSQMGCCDVSVVSNPEFLREGAAINDFMKPDRIIIGGSPEAEVVMRDLYACFIEHGVPLLCGSWETAEMIKYAANSLLALRVGFVNEVADLCEKVPGADVEDVARGIGLDPRIGPFFLKAGPGYGGSCFPKDTRAFLASGDDCGVNLSLVRAVIESNENRKHKMATRITALCGGSVFGKTVGVLGVTFKADTDDVRESPAMDILSLLKDQGAHLRVFDPQGMARAEKLLSPAHWCADIYDAALGADALIILTEWDAFGHLDFERLGALMHTPLLIDLRNMYVPSKVCDQGFVYRGIGRA